jgi:peroxiredoxin
LLQRGIFVSIRRLEREVAPSTLSKGANLKWSFAISGCCLLLLAANIALIRQNIQLKSQLTVPPPALEASAGAMVPDLRGVDLEGKKVEVAYGKDPRKVLVLVYSPTCTFCEENWPKWRQVIASLDRSAVRPVMVDVTSTTTAEFVSRHQFTELPVFVQVDPLVRVNYHLQLTPQTILVDSDGKVEKVWTGVLNGSSLAELKQRLSDGNSASASGSQRAYKAPEQR